METSEAAKALRAVNSEAQQRASVQNLEAARAARWTEERRLEHGRKMRAIRAARKIAKELENNS